MAEEIKSQEQQQESGPQTIKGDVSTILTGVGSLLDNTLTPVGNMLVQALESVNTVAQQILEGISKSLNNNQGSK
ncbi:hypothetical protein OO006_09465 [Prosthecochloris sp. SCSIO W1101]|uniref:hypothetical protein n=1 Tax=Prosthecochloris sp. SCSIO W1101 TaxID=2992242 RepID=UPI00223D4890|nr:hypothetical protein [Prosthecochloris sp. SCSIO W1101]UZJ40584.1 hypothetical protein OO006_09465 [Prosthecochloris sp. SCSIO W1101]